MACWSMGRDIGSISFVTIIEQLIEKRIKGEAMRLRAKRGMVEQWSMNFDDPHEVVPLIVGMRALLLIPC